MKKKYLPVISFVLLQSVLFCAANAAVSYTQSYQGIGSGVNTKQKSGVRMGQYNVKSNISVIEYDTYGSETGYYIDDAFGMTTKYDKNGNVLSKYKTNQTGKTIVYDKYGHAAGYFKAVSRTRTMFYDKDGTPLGYFEHDSNGLVKKYDMDGNHLNTYKKP